MPKESICERFAFGLTDLAASAQLGCQSQQRRTSEPFGSIAIQVAFDPQAKQTKSLADQLHQLRLSLGLCLHVGGGFVLVELGGVKGTVPFELVFVLGMVGVVDGFDEFVKAPNAADVFRRTSVFARDAARVRDTGARLDDLFEYDCMLPTIAEVVLYLAGRRSIDRRSGIGASEN